jgi:hypothetical protein
LNRMVLSILFFVFKLMLFFVIEQFCSFFLVSSKSVLILMKSKGWILVRDLAWKINKSSSGFRIVEPKWRWILDSSFIFCKSWIAILVAALRFSMSRQQGFFCRIYLRFSIICECRRLISGIKVFLCLHNKAASVAFVCDSP